MPSAQILKLSEQKEDAAAKPHLPFNLEDSPHRKYLAVCNRRSQRNSRLLIACVKQGIVSGIDAHMPAVADDIARLYLFYAHRIPCAPLCRRVAWQTYAECRIYLLYERRTVDAVCKARSAEYIRVAKKLHAVIHYRLSV